MVIDDRVPQDGRRTAYPAVAPIVAGDHLAELARRENLESAAEVDLQRERKYVLWGGAGAGSRWHVDPYGTDAWNALLSGRKRWAFYPPGATPPGVDIVPRFVSASRTLWTTAPAAADWFARDHPGAQIVTQEAGDVVYIPAGWWHATLCETPLRRDNAERDLRHNARQAHALMARSAVPRPRARGTGPPAPRRRRAAPCVLCLFLAFLPLRLLSLLARVLRLSFPYPATARPPSPPLLPSSPALDSRGAKPSAQQACSFR